MCRGHHCAWLAAAVAMATGCARRGPATFSGFVDEPISAVAAQSAGRVESIPIREGDRVRKGEVLAKLESSTIEGQVAQAEANVMRAREALRQAEANLSAEAPTVTWASADIARVRATRDQADVDFDRVRRLHAAGAVSAAELDAAQARALEARAAYDAAIASRSSTRGRVGVASVGIDDARAALAANEAALRIAEAQLAQTRIESPFDGLVVFRNLEEGEWAAPGTPIVTVQDTAHPWIRLDVAETTFRTLHLDQAAEVRVVALPGRALRGRVAEIGAEGDFAIDRDVKRGRPDVRTFLVRIALEDASTELRPGMTAEVTLLEGTESRRPPEARR